MPESFSDIKSFSPFLCCLSVYSLAIYPQLLRIICVNLEKSLKFSKKAIFNVLHILTKHIGEKSWEILSNSQGIKIQMEVNIWKS